VTYKNAWRMQNLIRSNLMEQDGDTKLSGEVEVDESYGGGKQRRQFGRPEVCALVSERSYDSRLRSREECAQRRIDAPSGEIAGVGLRALAVHHEGRSKASPEEAGALRERARTCSVAPQ